MKKRLFQGMVTVTFALLLVACGGTGSPADNEIYRSGIAVIDSRDVTVSGTFTQAGLQTAIGNIQIVTVEIVEGLPDFLIETIRRRLGLIDNIIFKQISENWETEVPGTVILNPNIINDQTALRSSINSALIDLEHWSLFTFYAPGVLVASATFPPDRTVITIPSSLGRIPVTMIGERAFYGSNLASAHIPSSVTAIGNFAFANSSLTSVDIGSGVRNIGEGAFQNNPDLVAVTIRRLLPETITIAAPTGTVPVNDRWEAFRVFYNDEGWRFGGGVIVSWSNGAWGR